MLKTNCKQVKTKIQAWIIQITKGGLKERGNISPAIIEQKPITAADKIFYQEKSWEIDHYGRRRAFYDWQLGLCSTVPAYRAVLYGEALKNKIAEWLEETKEETIKYDDETSENLFLWLVYREYEALLNKEQKETK